MIRFFVFGIPLAILALIAGAFFSVSSLATKRQNEMAIGSLGEPTKLNSIQYSDNAAGEVLQLVCNGLLKYGQNFEFEPDLAESYALSQTTTIVFVSSNAALTALLKLETRRAKWPAWKLVSATLRDQAVVITLGEPGMEISRAIAALFDPSSVLPLHDIRVEVEKDARGTLGRFRATPEGANPLRDWVESDTAFELTVAGDGDAFAGKLREFLADQPKAQVTVTGTTPFLAEPIVDFNLRRNVRWHDGQPFTSQDPAFTYEALMDDAHASPRKSDYLSILRVETPNPHRFRIIYRKPYSPALQSWLLSILPAHILKGKPDDWWQKNFNRSPIGTGPFKFAEWRVNEYVRLVRNPDFFRAPGPWLDSVVFRTLPDELTLRLAFETREVDFWDPVSPWAYRETSRKDRYEVFSYPGNSYGYVGWNLRRPLFRDLKVRQAIARAVNIPEMIKYILYGRGTQSTGPFLPRDWFFDPNVQPLTYDPDAARALLAEAGWKPGRDGILEKDGQRFAFTLITNQGNEIRKDIATLVQSDLRKLGIEVKVEVYEWAVFITKFVNKSDFDAMVLGWVLPPDFDQFAIWHSSQTGNEQLNRLYYQNPEVDNLLVSIREEFNRDRIISLAGKIQALIYHDQPATFLYVPETASAMWRGAFRVRRPDDKGGWIESPVQLTKAGWNLYTEWFYRPEFAPKP